MNDNPLSLPDLLRARADYESHGPDDILRQAADALEAFPAWVLPLDIASKVGAEMLEAVEKGYGPGHDDSHGSNHLVDEAIYRLTRPLDYSPSDDERRHTLIVAIGLLVNAHLTIDRAYQVGTYSVEDGQTHHEPYDGEDTPDYGPHEYVNVVGSGDCGLCGQPNFDPWHDKAVL